MENIEETIRKLAYLEGFNIEEAQLTYEKRKSLPSTAFCGPNRSYPAQDAAHVRNAFARLAQFGKRLKPEVRARILACLTRKAKRFGVEHEETIIFHTKVLETPTSEAQKIIDRFVKMEFPNLGKTTETKVDKAEVTDWYKKLGDSA